MNEQAQKLITDAGEKVRAYLEATEGFAVEQAPLLAQEIVRYGIWSNGISLLFGYTAALALVIVALRAGLTKGAWNGDLTVPAMACVWCALFAFFAFLIPTVEALPYFLKALITPRLYIMEQIGGLL